MLTTKTRYGIKALVYLARKPESDSLTSADEIAHKESIPQKFLEAIMTQLRKQGVVASRRGPSGGFTLARPAAEITLAEVVSALDGPMAAAPCLHDDRSASCDGCNEAPMCLLRGVVTEIRDAVVAVLGQTTLHDLVNQAIALERDTRAPMYYI